MHARLLRTLLAEPVCDPIALTGSAPGARPWLGRLADEFGRYAGHAARFVRGRAHLSTARFALPFEEQAMVLLIVPPFASLWYPSLAVHILQACARQAGCSAQVLYANVLLAAAIGEQHYEQIAAESVTLASERFFARCAFDLPALGHAAERMFDPQRIFGAERGVLYRGLYPDGKATTLGWLSKSITPERMKRLETMLPHWLDMLAAAIVARRYKIVGCTTTFQQTTASIALLNRVKALNPDVVTVLGGANCEGEMAEGLAELDIGVDYIFSGESEETFPDFVRAVAAGTAPSARILYGRPCEKMDALPAIACSEFFAQRARYLPHSAPLSATYLSYETSRGCWWGQKQHCTFCGLNGEGMAFRRKSPQRVIGELRALLSESPTRNVSMTDNIMPHEYFKTLLPRLSTELPGINIFYEQKSNLSFKDVVALKSAGVNTIQPGIEALSSSLLKLMRKGVSARRNLMLLRYGRIMGVQLNWNLLCGFPNDELAVYEETMALVPLIAHLQPPSGLWHLSIDRFSPYFFEPAKHNVTNVRPLPVYRDFLPDGADAAKIAYHFLGDYPTATHRHVEAVRELGAAVRAWAQAWERGDGKRPELKICRHRGQYVLVDTRGLAGAEQLRVLDDSEALLLLNASPYKESTDTAAALERKLAVVEDNWFVPLPVARRELFTALSREAGVSEPAVDQATPARAPDLVTP